MQIKTSHPSSRLRSTLETRRESFLTGPTLLASMMMMMTMGVFSVASTYLHTLASAKAEKPGLRKQHLSQCYEFQELAMTVLPVTVPKTALQSEISILRIRRGTFMVSHLITAMTTITRTFLHIL